MTDGTFRDGTTFCVSGGLGCIAFIRLQKGEQSIEFSIVPDDWNRLSDVVCEYFGDDVGVSK